MTKRYFFAEKTYNDTNPGKRREKSKLLVRRTHEIIRVEESDPNATFSINYPEFQDFQRVFLVRMGLLEEGASTRYLCNPMTYRETSRFVEKAADNIAKMPHDLITQTRDRVKLVHPNYHIDFRFSPAPENPDNFYAEGRFLGWNVHDAFVLEDALGLEDLVSMLGSRNVFCGMNNYVLFELTKGLSIGKNLSQFESISAALNDPSNYFIVRGPHKQKSAVA